MDVLARVSQQYCQCGTATLMCHVANALLLFRTIQMYLLIYYTAMAEFGGSISALQCMCSVDHVSHCTVVTLCGNVPATYQTLMNHLFLAYIGKCMDVYLDHIIIYLETLEQHIKDVKMVLDILESLPK